MKKLFTYLSILIIITGIIILFVAKNYPENILEVCLKRYASPEHVSRAVQNIGSYDYFNVYEIFSAEDAISVYSGNISLFLYDKDTQCLKLTLDDKEVVMGENYMYKHLKYNALGGEYNSEYGKYYVNCVIENNDRIYYRDLEILDGLQVKNQRLYVSLLNNKNIIMNPSNKLLELESSGIRYSKSVAYIDVISFMKKLFVFLLIMFTLLTIIALYKSNSKTYKKLSIAYNETKYDLELRRFIFKGLNFKKIIQYILCLIVQLLCVVAIVYLVAKMISIPTSFTVDISSIKSIIGLILEFIDLMKYYILNGFTPISLMIVKIILIYIVATILFLLISNKILIKKIVKDKTL